MGKPRSGKRPGKHKRPESLDHRKHYTRAHYGASVQQIEGNIQQKVLLSHYGVE